MNPSLFPEYNDQEIKPLMRLGDYVLGKYQKKETILTSDSLPLFNPLHSEAVLKDKKKRGIVNQRQQILEDIRTIINQERKDSKEKKKYPPITGRALAIKLSHIKDVTDLYFMDSEAKDYKKRGKGTYSQYIFGSIKVKK